ncbi:MAG: hypothetical protein ABIO70_29700 [Pseudomonadota bacterium]
MTSPRARRLLEALLLAAILAVLAGIGVRLWRWWELRCWNEQAMELAFRFNQPGLDRAPVTIPGRPHDVMSYNRNPEAIKRRTTFHVTTDARGYRGAGFEDRKAPGTFRIAVVGECVAFGVGVEDDEPWPRELEELLREAWPRAKVEVLDLGRVAPPREVFSEVRTALRTFGPDLLLLEPGASTLAFPEHTGMKPFRLWLPDGRYRAILADYRRGLEGARAQAARVGAPLALITPTCSSFFLPDGDLFVKEIESFAARFGLPLVHTTRLVRAAEEAQGLALETEGGRQRLVDRTAGEREVLLDVPAPQGNDKPHVAPEVYAWLDEHPEASQALMIDGNHPNPVGHTAIAAEVLRVLRDAGALTALER